LRYFSDEIDVNRVANGEFTPEARAFMCGVAATGSSHREIAEAVGASAPEVVTRITNHVKTTGTARTANRPRGKYKTTLRDERHLVVLARKYPEATYWDIIRRSGLNITPRTLRTNGARWAARDHPTRSAFLLQLRVPVLEL
jgi:hypothetical protein